jgi:UDP-N-acetylglucosamine 2-epimerase (non-hydrolysing)
MSKSKITVVVGTRPEIIRLSVIIKKLKDAFDLRIIYTGQNYDPSLSTIFFEELKIPRPDKFLEISSDSLGSFVGNLLIEIEKDLIEFPPHGFLVLGDTNSALSAIVAKRMLIPVYHLEAGNRSFDSNVPEEINRKIVDHSADFNLAYTETARSNLLREGLHPRSSAVIGSPLFEVLNFYSDEILESKVLTKYGLYPGEFFLFSSHRQENLDLPKRFSNLIQTLNQIANVYKMPIIVTTHPRLRRELERRDVAMNSLIQFCEPFGFFDYIKLQSNARLVISDSGSLSEESAILNFPSITFRDSMERPEALESGVLNLAGTTPEEVLEAIQVSEQSCNSLSRPADYLISDTSNRVLRFITSTVRQHSFWSGIRA